MSSSTSRVGEMHKSRSIRSLAMKEAFRDLHTIDRSTGKWKGLSKNASALQTCFPPPASSDMFSEPFFPMKTSKLQSLKLTSGHTVG